MKTGFPPTLLAVLAAGLCAGRAAAQTNEVPEAPREPAPPAAETALAEAALRDGLPSLALPAARAAYAAATGETARAEAFLALAAASERLSPPADFLRRLDADDLADAPAVPLAYYRARARAAVGRHEEAASLLDALREELPDDDPLRGPVLRDLAFSLSALGRSSDAAAALEPVAGGDPALALELGRLLLTSGEPARAAEVLAPLVGLRDAHALAATAALLRARALDDASETAAALEAASAIREDDASVPADLRALALAARAALSAPADLTAPLADGVAELALAATNLAVSPSVRLECGCTLLRLVARTPSAEADAPAIARRLVASAPRSPAVAAAVLAAAEGALAGGRPETALALCDLRAASFSVTDDESAVQSLRAHALSDLGRHGESAAAHLRAAELAPGPAAVAEALYAAAFEQREAGLGPQAAATLRRILDADPPPGEDVRARAEYLAAECLVPLDPAAAQEAFLAVADAHPAAPQRASALYRAAQLAAESADAADTNALLLARSLFERARGAAGAAEPPERAAARGALDALAARLAPPPAAATNAPAEAGGAAPSPRPNEVAEAALIQARAALNVALLNERQGDWSNALANLEIAISTPGAGEAAEQAAALRPSVLLALGRPDEAIAAHDIFTNAWPSSRWISDARFWRASRAFDTEENELAADLLRAFATNYPDSPRAPYARYLSAIALVRAQRPQEAVAAVRELADRHRDFPLLPAARFVEAEAECRLLEFDAAALLFRGIADSPAPEGADPALPLRARVRLGDCLFALGGDDPARFDESLEAYAAATNHPLCAATGLGPECAYKIGRSLERRGKTAAARDHYYAAVVRPFEARPDLDDAVWYARAVLGLAALLAPESPQESANVLRKIVGTDLPGAEEAARRLDALPAAP